MLKIPNFTLCVAPKRYWLRGADGKFKSVTITKKGTGVPVIEVPLLITKAGHARDTRTTLDLARSVVSLHNSALNKKRKEDARLRQAIKTMKGL